MIRFTVAFIALIGLVNTVSADSAFNRWATQGPDDWPANNVEDRRYVIPDGPCFGPSWLMPKCNPQEWRWPSTQLGVPGAKQYFPPKD